MKNIPTLEKNLKNVDKKLKRFKDAFTKAEYNAKLSLENIVKAKAEANDFATVNK